MSDAEEFALHLALPVGNDSPEGFAESLDDHARVHSGRRFDGCQSGGRRGCSKQTQPERLNRSAGHFRAELCVGDQQSTAATQIAFAEAAQVIKGGAESGDEGYRRSESRFSLRGGLAFLAKIEVLTPRLGGFHALPGALAYGQVRQSWWNHQRLVRATDHDIDGPIVDVEACGAKTRDCIHDEQSFRAGLAKGAGNRFDVVADPGGTLGGLNVHDA